MAKNSKIEWTDHTFNPWWGCTKVSAACKNCYAETWAKRVGAQVWGAKAPRRFLSEGHWRQPYRWEREAQRVGERRRVFCASMADVFEPRRELEVARAQLWEIIDATPHLDWLLLTKRPEQIAQLAPWTTNWPKNVWLGCTVETQRWAERRLDHLLSHPATIHFVSCEPLLGRINLAPWLPGGTSTHTLDWVIAGGESGHNARPMRPSWAGHLRDQCKATGVAFHFKQWGHWAPAYLADSNSNPRTLEVPDEGGERVQLAHVPKSQAGRELDGVVWDEFPAPAGEQV